MSEVPAINESVQKQPSKITALWGEAVLDEGFATIPHLLIRAQSKLDMTAREFQLIVTVLSFKKEAGFPFKPLKDIAEIIGCSGETIQTTAESLEKKGFLSRDRIGDPWRSQWVWNFRGLLFAITSDLTEQTQSDLTYTTQSDLTQTITKSLELDSKEKRLKDFVPTRKKAGTPRREKDSIPPELSESLTATVESFRQSVLEIRPNISAWSDDAKWLAKTRPQQIEQLWDVIRLDGHSLEEVNELLAAMVANHKETVHPGGFHWREQVLSLGKLRGKVGKSEETVFERLWTDYVLPKRSEHSNGDSSDLLVELSAIAEIPLRSGAHRAQDLATVKDLLGSTEIAFPGEGRTQVLEIIRDMKDDGVSKPVGYLPFIWAGAIKKRIERRREIVNRDIDYVETQLQMERNQYEGIRTLSSEWLERRKHLVERGELPQRTKREFSRMVMEALERRQAKSDANLKSLGIEVP